MSSQQPRGRSSRTFAAPTNLPHLTAREADVLDALAEGLTDEEIADLLFIAVSTVKTHLKSLRTKLGAKTRAQLVVHAFHRRHASVES